MKNINLQLLRKLSIPMLAILLVGGIVVYTGGFGNFLKLLGIKASGVETISLSTESQLLASDTGSVAELEGVSVLNQLEGIPADPDEAGFVTPIYSSEDGTKDAYNSHSYLSPVIDLKGTAPTLNAVITKYHQADGEELAFSYKTSATIEGLRSSGLIPLEMTGTSGGEIVTRTASLESTVQQYIQLSVRFVGGNFASRSAVYSFVVQFDSNIPEEGDVEPPIPFEQDGPIEPSEPFTTNDPAPVEEEDERATIALDFSKSASIPDKMDISLLTSTVVGVKTVVSLPAKTAEEITPLFSFPEPVEADYYSLVIEAEGYRTMVVPFRAMRKTQADVEIPAFEKSASTINFDLNRDGVVNSLDVTLLLSQIGA